MFPLACPVDAPQFYFCPTGSCPHIMFLLLSKSLQRDLMTQSWLCTLYWSKHFMLYLQSPSRWGQPAVRACTRIKRCAASYSCVLCALCVLWVVDSFSAIGGPRWRYITANISQAWPSMTLVDRLPALRRHIISWGQREPDARMIHGSILGRHPLKERVYYHHSHPRRDRKAWSTWSRSWSRSRSQSGSRYTSLFALAAPFVSDNARMPFTVCVLLMDTGMLHWIISATPWYSFRGSNLISCACGSVVIFSNNMYVCMRICVYGCMYVSMDVCICIYLYACMHACMHAHVTPYDSGRECSRQNSLSLWQIGMIHKLHHAVRKKLIYICIYIYIYTYVYI